MKTATRRPPRSARSQPWGQDSVAQGEMLSPVGPLRILVGPRGVMRIDLPNAAPPKEGALRRELETRGMGDLPLIVPGDADPRLKLVKDQLRDYFAGKRAKFDLPLDARGADFDHRVWRTVAAVPFGKTRTYADLARAAGAPKGFRASGAANGRNPLPIIVPCHRILGTGGRLTGYGGGIELKAWLLRHEGHDVQGERVVGESEGRRPRTRSTRRRHEAGRDRRTRGA